MIRRERKDFSKIKEIIEPPYLLELQEESYAAFLQAGTLPYEREDVGLEAVFRHVFPIEDFTGTAKLEYLGYEIGRWRCDCGEFKGLGGSNVVCDRCGQKVWTVPKYSVEECKEKALTYSAPLRILLRLIVFDKDENTGGLSVRDMREQKVFLGEIPLMTENSTFIINGVERVVVSQLHRSPGVVFEELRSASGSKPSILGRVIPYRGSWLDFEYDAKGFLYVKIDKRRKFLISTLLLAVGMSPEEILREFYDIERIYIRDKGKTFLREVRECLIGQRVSTDVADPKTGDVLVRAGRKVTQAAFKRILSIGLTSIPLAEDALCGKVVAHDVVGPETGEVWIQCNETITPEKLEQLRLHVKEIGVVVLERDSIDPSVREALAQDKANAPEEAQKEVYKKMRPGEPPTPEVAKEFFHRLFFDPDRFDLSEVGRLKVNRKLGFSDDEVPLSVRVLRNEDIIAIVKYMMRLRLGHEQVDDIDHLGNRRIRAVGELLENQLRAGLVRIQRAIREKMSIEDVESMMPNDLMSAKPFSAVVKSFFSSGQLSQFMDQTNPLSEVTHKRRLSALGPGGLTRERAGFEVRDVHPSHYGRICPIETPEGPNIGLITSLSVYARVNRFGFIETPYRRVIEGRVTNEVVYLTAFEEERYTIAQANAPVDDEGRFLKDRVSSRKKGEFVTVPPEELGFMDVSPKQLVSVSAALIPFLEHDDANRALMGCNMQRQSVPLLRSQAPLVGTGMERGVALDSGVMVVARRPGVVKSVDSSRVIVMVDEEAGGGMDLYRLSKFQRSNQGTCFNHRPIVRKGQRIKAGEVVADGASTHDGELALGKNVLAAFMPWGGYNFEDAILVSQKLVKEDTYTSIHIEVFEAEARDTKLGPEEITRDIPNLGAEALKDLDDTGIVRIGTRVDAGDILVGKVTPKGEQYLTPEEKLLRAIFGEKAREVKDTSLRVPPGVEGVVMGVKIFTRKALGYDPAKERQEEEESKRLETEFQARMEIIWEEEAQGLRSLLEGKKVGSEVKDPETGEVLVKKGGVLTSQILRVLPPYYLRNIEAEFSPKEEERWQEIIQRTNMEIERTKILKGEALDKLQRPDELPPGVLKRVKVYVAQKRKLQVGDKMAGRHGNKGVISKILKEEDMPFLPDGTPVEIVLNPLGVPSRMNLGQILETHLGWAAAGMGKRLGEILEKARDGLAKELRRELKRIYAPQDGFLKGLTDDEIVALGKKLAEEGVPMASPVFDGAHEAEIKAFLKEAGLPITGRARLYDGRIGELFDQTVTVGYIYMLKLHHLVEEKVHARSTGPYSLVTQQPLGGKAHFGGQRLGEMEVWALEAHGAAHALQEMLTVKSDDVAGRNRMYQAIVKGNPAIEVGIPESFRVLVKELQGLCIDVDVMEKKRKGEE
jgi:DNA-directed RNA polymerase subunit beta